LLEITTRTNHQKTAQPRVCIGGKYLSRRVLDKLKQHVEIMQ